MTTPAIKAATTSGNSREEINIALQQMATSMNQALNPPGIPKAILDAGGGGGLGTAASGKSLAPVPNPNDNPSGYLTNADKVVLVSQWQSERALQVGSASIFAGGTDTVSGAYGTAAYGLLAYGMGGLIGSGDSTLTPAPGSLDYQANSVGINHVAYDSAIQALSDNLRANGAPDNWPSVWPDGTTLTVPGLELALAGWWATVKSARVALQNAIANHGQLTANSATTLTGGNLVPNGDSSAGIVSGVGGNFVASTLAIGYPGYQGGLYVRDNNLVPAGNNGLLTAKIGCVVGDIFNLDYAYYAPMSIYSPGPIMVFFDGSGNPLGGGSYAPTGISPGRPQFIYGWDAWHMTSSQITAPTSSAYCYLAIPPAVTSGRLLLGAIALIQQKAVATPAIAGLVKVGAGLTADATGLLNLLAVPGTPATASSNAVTHKIPIVIGGVTYYLVASTSAT